MTKEEIKERRRLDHIKNRERDNANAKARYLKNRQDPNWVKLAKEKAKLQREKHREKIRAQFKEKSNRIKNYWIEQMGGKCCKCGSKEDLVFHHKDPNTKSFNLGNSWTHSPKKVEAEVKKCILICKKCHKELHKGENLTWGTRIKKVMCIETNKIYTSIALCAKDMNLNHREISAVCLNKKSDINGYHFKYIV